MSFNPIIERRKKLKKDKKKIIITIATLFIGLAVLVGGIILAPKAEDSTKGSAETKKKVERTEEIVTEDLDVKEDKEENFLPYTNLNNLSYEVLSHRYEASKKAEGNYEVIFDIVSTSLTKADYEALADSVQKLSEESEKKKVNKVTIHHFKSPENYESIQASNYVVGKDLISTVIYEYRSPEPKVDDTQEDTHKEEVSIENEGNIDALSYDVQDVTANNSTTTYDVVVTGDTQNLSTFISGFVHLHKSLNPSDQKIALQLYNSSESLQSKTPNWLFDGKTLTTKN